MRARRGIDELDRPCQMSVDRPSDSTPGVVDVLKSSCKTRALFSALTGLST